MKKAGILMPVASLPSRLGCGSFGQEALDFIDLCSESGFHIWQILPMNPLGYGNSPYQPYSSFAMDDLFISLDLLYDKGLLKEKAPDFMKDGELVEYDDVRAFREPYLREAYAAFSGSEDLNFVNFSYQEWVKDYSRYMAFRKASGGKCWVDWKDDLKDGTADIHPYQDEILYQVFLQYMLFLQWKDVKQYANDKGIEIMGDIPFYVGLDSADVWAHQDNFLLDKDGRPIFIAGVPPDYFSPTGQRWGNPIYDWEFMEKDGFTFWIERIAYTQRLFDIVRIDHFRAFDTYWKIKSSCPTAIDGEWVEAPGYALFDKLLETLPDLQLVAEDLGDLRPEVHVLRDHYNFPGMRVIQFSYDPKGMPEDKEVLVVYTGTHDNEPVRAWYQEKPKKEQRGILRSLNKMGYKTGNFNDNMISYALDSNADTVIVPMSDWLNGGMEYRINTPGTVGSPNWMWRMKDLRAFKKRTKKIKKMIEDSGRTGA